MLSDVVKEVLAGSISVKDKDEVIVIFEVVKKSCHSKDLGDLGQVEDLRGNTITI